MKTFRTIVASVCAALLAVGCVCSPKVDPQPSVISKSVVDSASYAFGVYMGKMAHNTNLGDLNLNKVIAGYKAAVKDSEKELPEPGEILNEFMSKRQNAMAEVNKINGQKFLAKNAKSKDVTTTESGLQYKVIGECAGVQPGPKDTVTVNYEGSLLDGTVFDSSYDRGEPIEFPLNQVIRGWTEGLQLAHVGDSLVLWIPSELAYGDSGYGPGGPNQTLVFKVKLLDVKPYVEPEENPAE